MSVAVKDVEPFTYCSLSHKGPVSDIQDVIGQLILDMQSQGLLPMGPMIVIVFSLSNVCMGPKLPVGREKERILSAISGWGQDIRGRRTAEEAGA